MFPSLRDGIEPGPSPMFPMSSSSEERGRQQKSKTASARHGFEPSLSLKTWVFVFWKLEVRRRSKFKPKLTSQKCIFLKKIVYLLFKKNTKMGRKNFFIFQAQMRTENSRKRRWNSNKPQNLDRSPSVRFGIVQDQKLYSIVFRIWKLDSTWVRKKWFGPMSSQRGETTVSRRALPWPWAGRTRTLTTNLKESP